MSITVRDMMLKLVNRIDPMGSDPANPQNPPVYFTASNIGTFNGKFSAQRQLDIYNEARYEVLRYLQFSLPKEKLTMLAEGPLKEVSVNTAGGAVTLPSDYFAIADVSSANREIYIVPPAYRTAVRRGYNPYRTESAAVNFLIPQGRTLQDPNGNANLPDATPVSVSYYALASFALTDVTGGVTPETIDDVFMTSLLEVGEAISLEYGRQDLLKLLQVQLGGGA